MFAKILMLFIMPLQVLAAVVPFSHDHEVTEKLLKEGYSFRESSLPELIKTLVRADEDPEVERTAYTNLPKFMPFSDETSIAILDGVLRNVTQGRENILYRTILMWFLRTPLSHYARWRLVKLMHRFPEPDEKRRSALVLVRYDDTRDQAVGGLRDVLSLKQDPSARTQAAFELLRFGAFHEEAEATLRELLTSARTAEVVLFYAADQYFDVVSPKLIEELRKTLPLFTDSKQYMNNVKRINDIPTRALGTECAAEMESSNVVRLFPGKSHAP